ncbi:MAG: Asp-tRNA(Asn)/Glu-tRNA(Gln) amidotransferase subunit GatC [Planctomycetota bacterium]
MAITLDEIKWIAHLSRLELKPEELIAASTQLSSILNYINQLQEVNTDNVEPLAHALDVSNVFREDVLKESINVNEALSNAPDRQGNFYGVPAILE